MKVKRQSKLLGLTNDFLVVDCMQQGLLHCRSCGGHSLIVISSQSHQLHWCSHCVDRLTLTTFDDVTGLPVRSRQEITRWVDNGSVQLIETAERTLIITFQEHQSSNDGIIGSEGPIQQLLDS